MKHLANQGFCISAFLLVALTSHGLSEQSDFLAESEKRARQILRKSIEALGGETFLKAQDITVAGRFYQFRHDRLQGVGHFHSYDKYPLKSRTEFGKKKEIISINNGDKGWKIEYKVIKEQSAEEIKNFHINMKHNLDYILRFRLSEEDLRFRHLGRSHIDLQDAEGVQLIDKEGDKIKIFVNVDSYLPVKMEYKSPGSGKRWPTDDEEFFHNYHKIQGIQIPFTTLRFSNGYKSAEVQIESARINPGLPDSLFVADLNQ